MLGVVSGAAPDAVARLVSVNFERFIQDSSEQLLFLDRSKDSA